MTVREYLKKVAKNEFGIRVAVAEYVLENTSSDEEAKQLLDDICTHGCASGVVTTMIYYEDTHAFFDGHYGEIMELREQYEYDPPYDTDYKNHMAWFAFEERAHELREEVEDLEIEE